MSSLISRSRANSRNLEIKNKPAVYSTRSASNSQTRMYGGGPKTKKMGILGLDTRVKVPTQFNVWAKNMAIISSLYCIILGFCALIWGGVEERFGLTYGIVGSYTIMLGVYIYLFEKVLFTTRSPSAIPYRGLMYFIVGFPLFIAYPTIIAGVCVYITGFVQCVSAFYEESVKPKKRKPMAKAAPVKPTGDATDSKSPVTASKMKILASNGGVDLVEQDSSTWCESLKAWLIYLQNTNKLGTKLFILTYIIGNIIIFIFALQLWFMINDELDVTESNRTKSFVNNTYM